MYRNNKELLPFAKLEGMIRGYFKNRPAAAYAALDTEIRTCSFLNRDSEGNYQFVHRSFMEFFVARALAAEVQRESYKLFAVRPVTPEINNFLRGFLSQPDVVWKAIEWTKAAPEATGFVGANAISVLRTMGAQLTERDFSKAVLKGADFSSCFLTGSAFVEANVAGANFSNATMSDVNFSFADLTGVIIREYTNTTSLAWTSDYLVAGGEDGVVRLYSILNWELKHTLRGHEDPVRIAAVSHSGQFLFTLSERRLIAWDTTGFVRYAEFGKRDAEYGLLKFHCLPNGYEIRVHGETEPMFIPLAALFMRVEELEISVRTYNCLMNMPALMLKDFVFKRESDLLKSKFFGKKSLNELRELLDILGLKLGMTLMPEGLQEHKGSVGRYSVNVRRDRIELEQIANEQIIVVESPKTSDHFSGPASYSTIYSLLAAATESGHTYIWNVHSATPVATLSRPELECRGMVLTGAQGLENPISHDMQTTLGQWLESHGALPAAKVDGHPKKQPARRRSR